MTKKLKIIPLGGLGEIGKNTTLIQYGRNHLLIDCGLMFPENELYGIDLVLPQFDHILQNEETLRGILLTHGHLDHIGGLPYLLKHINVPIYGTDLTIGMVKNLLSEVKLPHEPTFHIITDKQQINFGPLRVNSFAVAHSIPASIGYVIDTPAGAIVHTGDYKLDETPSGGRTTDLKRLRKLTSKGVVALLGDSTNADRPGRTPTEQLVADTLDQLFAQAKDQRIIIATFASVLARLQEIISLAHKYGRKVAITGRSMLQNIELARDLGHLKIPKGILVDITKSIPDHKCLILATGSQGEPRSALNRMAEGSHRHIEVHENDTIIISGGTIPGNEEDVGRMLNNLFARGANVIYGRLATVHVSGHGSREDMRIMLETVRPRFLIPVHGETRHLHLHKRLAQETGMGKDDVFILQNGSIWATDGKQAAVEGAVEAKDIYVDGTLIGEIGEPVLRDRGRLAQDGFVAVYVPMNKRHKLAGTPRIVSYGFVPTENSKQLLNAAQAALTRELKRSKRGKSHRQTVHDTLQTFFYRKTGSRPVILPTIVHTK